MDEKQQASEHNGVPKGQLATACARDPYWDVVKALLISLVVLGHAVQFARGGNFWGDPLFKAIYLFHMPLFVMVSGYFAIQGIKKHGRRYLWRTARHLLIPSLFNPMVYIALRAARSYWHGQTPTMWWGFVLLMAWFLICIFECGVFTWVLLRFKSMWWRVAWFVIPMLLAMVCPVFPHAGQFTFLYPFFLLGAWVHARRCKLGNVWIGLASLAVYIGVFCIFRDNWYVYRSPMASLPDNPDVVAVYLVRMVGGIAGCFLFLFITRHLTMLTRSRLLQKLGGSTLAIYLLQIYFWDFVWIAHCPNISIWMCFPLTAGVVILCYGVHQLLKRVPVLCFLMFGELRDIRNQGATSKFQA